MTHSRISRRWPVVAVEMLLAIAARSAGTTAAVRYSPAEWFRKSPTDRRRSAWSRWLKRLAAAGLVERLTETRRDRVRSVRLTAEGWLWIEVNRGGCDVEELGLEPLEPTRFDYPPLSLNP